MNDYETGRMHGISIGLGYVRGYASATRDENVLYALNKYIENFEGELELMLQEEAEDEA